MPSFAFQRYSNIALSVFIESCECTIRWKYNKWNVFKQSFKLCMKRDSESERKNIAFCVMEINWAIEQQFILAAARLKPNTSLIYTILFIHTIMQAKHKDEYGWKIY